jgi:hypothetical protein
MMMMMMILRQMDIHEQYLKLLMKKYLLNENQNEMNIVAVYLLLIFVLKMTMMMVVVVLVHWKILMIEVYAIDDVKPNWQDN